MEQQVQFVNAQGESLAGTLHQPEQSVVGGVVAGHCFTCSRHTGILRRICKDLSNAGFLVLRFDFSGNGQSQGRFEQSTWSKQIQEMELAVAWLQQQGVSWIGLAGHSLGAAIALVTASRLPRIAAVCRVAGRVSDARSMHFLTPPQQERLEEDGQVDFSSRGRQLTISSAFFDDAGRHDLIAATKTLQIPMLVVHGDHDEIIPVSEAYLAKSINPDMVQLSIVPGGNHMLSGADHQQQVSRTVTEWFARQAGLPRPE